jgi:hypothetical protein
MEVFLSLEGMWKQDDGRERVVPFRPDGPGTLVLSRRVYWDEIPTDTLYLYREGAGWRCETFVNGRLISVRERPFGETLDALPPRFWIRGDNEVRLRLTAGGRNATDGRDHYPPLFAGIHAPIYLLKRSSPIREYSDSLPPQHSSLPPFSHPRLCVCDTVMWYMPYASAEEALYSPLDFEADVKRMLSALPGMRSSRGLIMEKTRRWMIEDTLWRRMYADSIKEAAERGWRFYLWQRGDTTVEPPWVVDSSRLSFPSKFVPGSFPWESSEYFQEHYGTVGLYFPVAPPQQYLETMGRYGMCMSPEPGRWNASWRSYSTVMGLAPSAWHDRSASPTSAYGSFEPPALREMGTFSHLVVALILTTLVWAAMWKLGDPGSFRLLNAVSRTSRKLAETHKESGVLSGAIFYLLPALRAWLMAATVTFLLSGLWMRGMPAFDFWHETALWEGLHLYAARPTALFVRLWGIFLAFLASKWLFFRVLEGIYRRRAMGRRWMNLEAIADFPGLWITAAVSALWALVPGAEGGLAVAMTAIAATVFLVRLGLLWSGAEAALKAPKLIIFLYLCVTEALPIFLALA